MVAIVFITQSNQYGLHYILMVFLAHSDRISLHNCTAIGKSYHANQASTVEALPVIMSNLARVGFKIKC